MQVETLALIKVIIAFIAGALLGIEREYRSEPAGFRTMILICVGSTVFTLLSISFADGKIGIGDRIASNIITGVGFIGAGVIFKEGLTVRGITSAATIWIAAAIGMAIGLGYYKVAALVFILVMATLIGLMHFEERLDKLHQIKLYNISFFPDNYSVELLEEEFAELKIKFDRYKLTKNNKEVTAYYQIEGTQFLHEELTRYLVKHDEISSFVV
jgi:putative Mg2+ transporter-C (MgtC) family protein